MLRPRCRQRGRQGGSRGVFDFDTTTLALIATYPATADFSSIALSDDGRFLYAAAEGGLAADGSPAPANGTSVTVFDTSDGSVRLLAGQLGSADLVFTEPILR